MTDEEVDLDCQKLIPSDVCVRPIDADIPVSRRKTSTSR